MTISGEVNVRQGISSEANVRHGISGDLQMPRIVGGGSITVDSELSSTSENPVQNKVITAALNKKQNIPDNEGTTGQVLTKTDQGAIWEDTNIPDSVWIKKTVSGDPVTFSDGAAGAPLQALTGTITAADSAGTPTPKDRATVFRTGKNLLGGVLLGEALQYKCEAVIDSEAGTARYNASRINNTTKVGLSAFIGLHFKPDKQYTVILFGRHEGSKIGSNIAVKYKDGSTGRVLFEKSDGTDSYARLVTSGAKQPEALVMTNIYAGSVTLYLDRCGVFEGDVALEDFSPWQGTAQDIPFTDGSGAPLTVYGASLNVTEGILTATHGSDGALLPEPLVYPLAPVPVNTATGENAVWLRFMYGDSGHPDSETVSEVTYCADATIAYEHLDQETAKKSMVARVEDGMTATRNYTVGELLIVEDTLYRVTANIPNGGAITLGTNVTVTTMAAEIAASGGGSGGSSITVDSALSSTSKNPVQNKVVKTALDDKAATSSVPASASVSNAGELSFANGAGTQLFTVQLPLYAGGVD